MSAADRWDAIDAAPVAPTAPASAAAPSAAPTSAADRWDAIAPDAGKSKAPGDAPTAEDGLDSLATRGLRATGEMLLTPAKVALNQASAAGSSILAGWRGLAAIASGAGLDEAVRQVQSPELAGGARAATYEPAAGTPAARVDSAVQSPANPMNWPSIVAHKAGDVTMDATGSPAAATAVETGLNAIPLVMGGKSAVARAEPRVVGSGSIAPRDIPISQIAQGENLDVPTVMRRGGMQAVETPAKTPLALVPVEGKPDAVPTPAPRPVLSLVPAEKAPAPSGASSAFDAAETPAEATEAAEATAPKFAESAPSADVGQKLPLDQQLARAQVLSRVGIEDLRNSAVEGDAQAAADDFQTSKLNNPAGNLLKTKLDAERAALTDNAQQIVRDTGGTLGTDGQTLEARGHTILAPLAGYRQWFTDQTNGLYTEARARAAGQPVALDSFNTVLGTDSKFANTDTIELRKGIQSRMQELGMVDDSGNPLPATVEQAENLRQYVNEEWSPKSNGRIRELKNALDDDVFSAAGEDLFAKARALHAMKQSIFADPKGLSSILDSEGINRKVPVEKIADTVAALPNAQFAHIVKTLKTVPPELAPQAAGALSEIKAQFANRISDAGSGRVGQWGARDVSGYLNKNSAKLGMVFEPPELAKIADLNDAGHIVAQDRSYPGAAVQKHNLLRSGVMAALPAFGATVGGFLAGGPGAFVGQTAMAIAAGRASEAAQLRSVQKRFTKISDFPK